MTPFQQSLYEELAQSKTVKNMSENESINSNGLELILLFKKLCNRILMLILDPMLINDTEKLQKNGFKSIISIINKSNSCRSFDPTHSGIILA